MDRAEDRDRAALAAVPAALDADRADQPGRPEDVVAHEHGWPPLGPWIAVVLGVLVVPMMLAMGLTWSGAGADDPVAQAVSARVVNATDLEQEYGIRVKLVAVIAAGGLVNVRFTVVDKDKASHLLHDSAALPALYVEDRGAVLRSSQAKAHKMTVVDGGSYFLLYPNSGGLVQAGTGVSVVIDEVRLESVTAQS